MTSSTPGKLPSLLVFTPFQFSSSVQKEGRDKFTLLIASVNKSGPSFDTSNLEIPVNGCPLTLTVEYGDFSEPLSKAVDALRQAKKYAANENQVAALNYYIKSYVTRRFVMALRKPF